MRHQIDVSGPSIADLERAITALRSAGAPDDAELRLRIRTGWSVDGGAAKTITASWADQRSG